jgi:hypothetical protein
MNNKQLEEKFENILENYFRGPEEMDEDDIGFEISCLALDIEDLESYMEIITDEENLKKYKELRDTLQKRYDIFYDLYLEYEAKNISREYLYPEDTMDSNAYYAECVDACYDW